MDKRTHRLFVLVSILALMGFSTAIHGTSHRNGASLWAGSMHWFELETNGICKPSPVNRLVRPSVCLGFEKSLPLLASR